MDIPSILVTEDDADILELITYSLEAEGYKVYAAKTLGELLGGQIAELQRPVQQRRILVLETRFRVMFWLVFDVVLHRRDLTPT